VQSLQQKIAPIQGGQSIAHRRASKCANLREGGFDFDGNFRVSESETGEGRKERPAKR